jgi:hypothetical protein
MTRINRPTAAAFLILSATFIAGLLIGLAA